MSGKTPMNMMGSFADAIPALPGANWALMVKPQARLAEAMLRHNIETLEFLKARCERDKEFLGTIARAETPTEAISLWQGFWQKMLADYAAETDKLAASAAKLTEEAIRSATEDGAAALAPKGKAE